MRYFIGFLITLGLVIVLILLLFTGGDDGPKKPKTPRTLASYSSTEAVVRMSISGPITADSTHNQVRVTVGKDDATYDQIRGYEDHIVNTQSFANNESAYNNFLYALARMGFTKGDNSKLLANEKGFCPLGARYVFELIDGDKTIQRYWATSCNGTKTYKGNVSATLQLFQAQIPGYQDLTEDISLD